MSKGDKKERVYDCTVVGGGPAGVTAAIYLARKRADFLMISENIGGQVGKSSVVENCPSYKSVSGADLAKKMEEHLEEYDFDLKRERAEKIEKDGEYFKIKSGSEAYLSKTVILATGARPRKLGIPGENEFEGRGVTYCATCDAPLFKDKEVAVIGGGNTGLETAVQLLDIASKVYLIDISDRLAADKVLVDKVGKSPKAEIITGARTAEISGGDFVEDIKIEKGGNDIHLPVQGVFVSIGYLPNAEIVKGLAELNEKKEVIVDDYQRTDAEGLFSAGDCTDKPYKQIATAAGEGCTAALAVYDFLTRK